MTRFAVTGAFGFSGRHIAGRLLDRGDAVVNLTNHPDRPDPFAGRVRSLPLSFDRPDDLAGALDGVDVLVNTYWIRFPRAGASHADAVGHSRILFEAAARAGVGRVVHVSIANPSPGSRQSYYRGKAQVEALLATSGLSHAVLRPTVLFGDEPILVNAIAWLLLRLPVFAIPGDGRYAVQPVAVEDLAELVITAAAEPATVTWDAVGPEVYSFEELVVAVRDAIGARCRVVHAPTPVALAAAGAFGRLLGDVLLTSEELESLTSNCLVSSEIPRGHRRFSEWLAANRRVLGRRYLPEVSRHYAPSRCG